MIGGVVSKDREPAPGEVVPHPDIVFLRLAIAGHDDHHGSRRGQDGSGAIVVEGDALPPQTLARRQLADDLGLALRSLHAAGEREDLSHQRRDPPPAVLFEMEKADPDSNRTWLQRGWRVRIRTGPDDFSDHGTGHLLHAEARGAQELRWRR